MQTNVRTPADIFNQPQRLLVPLFQRPYVWTEEKQWEPLWNDVERVAGRMLTLGPSALQAHFLGAVVIQQIQNSVGDLQTRIVIDGQQRLTTLQILLDAVHAVFELRGFKQSAARLDYLVANAQAFCRKPEDRFKVWPTNKDRAAFNEVMGKTPPIDYDELKHAESRLVQAHRYFTQQTEAWLDEASNHSIEQRADALENTVSKLLQLVVIDLQVDENAQEIFETLNARGTPLTPVDLIKNFVFQRLSEEGADVESIYKAYWEQYENKFWEEEIMSGRLRRPRVVVFFNHWLFSMLGEDVNSNEVFATFKRFLLDRPELGTLDLIKRIHRAATVYADISIKGASGNGEVDRVALFAYRAEAMQSDVVKPFIMALLDPDRVETIPAATIDVIIDEVESWLVRRMLVRVTARAYNRFIADLVNIVRTVSPDNIHHDVRSFLARQRGDSTFWPDDAMVRQSVSRMPIYKRISRSRLRMLLEAIEDYQRGYGTGRQGLTGVRTPRGMYSIEHLMPQAWEANWAEPADGDHVMRKERIHTLGNLTLVTQALNSKVSNGSWVDKERALNQHGVVLMNNRLADYTREAWSDEHIDRRTSDMIDTILSIWRVPEGHVIETFSEIDAGSSNVSLRDLLRTGLITAGVELVATMQVHDNVIATVTEDGRILMDGKLYETPSGAGCAVRSGRATNGWSFWAVNDERRIQLRTFRQLYRILQERGEGAEIDIEDELAQLGGDEVEGVGTLWLRYWTRFRKYLEEQRSPLTIQTPRAQNWTNSPTGRSRCWFSLTVWSYSPLLQDSRPGINVLLNIRGEGWYDQLYARRREIEESLGTELEWQNHPGQRTQYLILRAWFDPTNEEQWPECFAWHMNTLAKLREVLLPYILELS